MTICISDSALHLIIQPVDHELLARRHAAWHDMHAASLRSVMAVYLHSLAAAASRASGLMLPEPWVCLRKLSIIY